MKIHFVSFTGEFHSDSKYTKAKDDLLCMLDKFNIFDTITIFNKDHLMEDSDFHPHIPFILDNKRGFGYWIWKPYIILKKMLTLDDGDLIFYADICTSIRVEGRERFLEYIQSAKNNKYGNLFFPYANPQYPRICDWCKMDTIKFLDAEDIMYQSEVVPGILFMTVNDENKKLLHRWYNIMNNYHLIDDSPSITPNVPSFIEHRHDQSIFSILVRKFYPEAISDIYTDEIYFNQRPKEGEKFPIWTQSNHY